MSFLLKKTFKFSNRFFLNHQRKFIGSNAVYQTDTNKVKLKGKYLKSRNPDMPTLFWFPDYLEPAENYEKWFTDPSNKVLEYRNVWLINPRNFGDSDHHDSFDMEEICNDVFRFLEEKRLTFVTAGGLGYGAKIASAFGSFYHDRVSGVACFEGGPIDHSYHEAWEEVRNLIIECSKIPLDSNHNDVFRRIDKATNISYWRTIAKMNVIEGKSGGFQWKCNIEKLAENVKKMHRSDLCKWSTSYGLYPGRAFVTFAEYSKWIFLNTNTIPFYKFFPKLEGTFPSNHFNIVYGEENPLNHRIHEFPEEDRLSVSTRFSRWLRHHDGVHILLSDRSELGHFGIEARESGSLGIPAYETVPEHLHHNYRYTDAYTKSKKSRGVEAAKVGEFGKKNTYSNPDSW